MKLIRIPTQELDKVWGLVDKDIRQALAYSGQLTDSEFVLENAKEDKFQVWILWDESALRCAHAYTYTTSRTTANHHHHTHHSPSCFTQASSPPPAFSSLSPGYRSSLPAPFSSPAGANSVPSRADSATAWWTSTLWRTSSRSSTTSVRIVTKMYATSSSTRCFRF